MNNKHYTVKNSIGGCFCKKCFNWSNMPDGLLDEECKATKVEIKENLKRYKKLTNTK